MNVLYKKCLLRMVLFLSYALLGGWLFSLLEKRQEPNMVTANRLLTNLRMEMKIKYNMTNTTDFDKFVQAAYKASNLRQKLDWNFFTGTSFAMSALMTVGYGDITPQTPLGQALTIPFCLIGLPLNMLFLKTAGELILVILKRLQICVEGKVLCRKNPQTTILKDVLMVLIVISSLIALLATMVVYAKDWTFIEGVYCWFITFTTIGFGDYVPFQNLDNQYDAENQTIEDEMELWSFLTMFLAPYVTGFCLISSLLNLLVDWSEKIKLSLSSCGMYDMCGRVKIKNNEFCMGETTLNHPMARNNTTDISLKSMSFRRFSY